MTGEKPAGAGVSGSGRPIGCEPTLVVGIGASAGGLQALEQFFRAVDPGTEMAFVVVQHLSPEHESLMPELLERHTRLPIHRVRDGIRVERGAIYVISPGHDLTYEAGRLRQRRLGPEMRLHLPVDELFSSLARELAGRAVAVVLSGSGSDGMRGVRAVKEAGGFVLAQDLEEAAFEGMPGSAQSTGIVDIVLRVSDIPQAIERIADSVAQRLGAVTPVSLESTANNVLSSILQTIELETGRDFSGYKRTTILRRIERRMHLQGLHELEDYAEQLRGDTEEVAILHRDFLISVTRFFRDADAFELLRGHLVPQLLADAPADGGLRLWCSGCATGEEAYSLAMLVLEAMEDVGDTRDVRIFATDVDEDALTVAGNGLYPKSIVADVSPERLDRFFVLEGEDYRVSKAVRSRVIFAPHDLMTDPPLTSMNLISCRNLLIYLEKPLQDRALRNLAYSLKPGGTLFLGPSESLGELSHAFEPLDRKWKLFQRTASGVALQPGFGRFSGVGRALTGTPARRATAAMPSSAAEVEEILRLVLGQLALSCVVVDRHGAVLHVLGDVGRYLRLQTGRAQMDLHHLAPRELEILLSAAMRRAEETGKEVFYRGPYGRGSTEHVSIRVTPHLLRGREQVMLIGFEQATDGGAAASESEDAEQLGAGSERVQVLEEELQHTRENLQAMIEELETSNEELQATNEELMSSNEELHAMNEELQSVNEELHTVNAEYQKKIQELTQLKDDVDNLLRSTRIGTLFLDRELCIRSFTPTAVRYVSLLHQDIGRPIEHLSSHFVDLDLSRTARQVLEDGETVEYPVRTEDGGSVLVRFLPYLSEGELEQGGVVVTLVDVSDLKRAQENLQVVIDSIPANVALLDRDAKITLVNRGWRSFGEENGARDPASLGVGANYLAAIGDRDTDEAARQAASGIQQVLRGDEETFYLEYPCHGAGVERFFMMHVSRVGEPVRGALVSHVDISDPVRGRAGRT